MYDVFKKLNEKTKYPKLAINLCNFSSTGNTLLFKITNKCNLNCDYCLWKFHGVDVASYGTTPMEIPIEKIKTFCSSYSNFCKIDRLDKIVITGGEPFLIKNIDKIIEELSSICGEISICTNGICDVEEYMLRSIFEKNILRKIIISLDSYNDKHTAKIVKFISSLKQYKTQYNSNVDIEVNIVAPDKFLVDNQTEKYISFWKNNNINRINISYRMQGSANFSKENFKKNM